MDSTALEAHTPMLDDWYEKLANMESIKIMNEHLNIENDANRKLPPREYA